MLIRRTRHCLVDLSGEASVAAAVQWWKTLTAAAGEGMVLEPAGGMGRGPCRTAREPRGAGRTALD